MKSGEMSADAECREEREVMKRYIDKLRNMMYYKKGRINFPAFFIDEPICTGSWLKHL